MDWYERVRQITIDSGVEKKPTFFGFRQEGQNNLFIFHLFFFISPSSNYNIITNDVKSLNILDITLSDEFSSADIVES